MGKRLSWVCPPQKGTQKHAVNSMPFSCKVSQYNHTQMDQAAPLQPLLSERVPFFCLPACSNLPVHSAGVQKPGWVWGDSGLEEGGQWQAVAVATGRGPALGEGGGGAEVGGFPWQQMEHVPHFGGMLLSLILVTHLVLGTEHQACLCCHLCVLPTSFLVRSHWDEVGFFPIRDAPLLISFYWWECNYFTSSSRITDCSFKYVVKLYSSASY